MREDWRTKLQYWAVYGFGHLVSLLPFWLLYLLSDVLYFFVYHVVRYRRDVARENIAGSFPEKPQKELRGIERKFYHFFCDYVFETLKLMTVSRKSMAKRITFKGLEQLEDAFHKEGHPFVFIYLGHYCNWEWIASMPWFVSPSIHCAQIYHPIYNKAVDRFFLELRGRFGGESIPMRATLRRIVQLKREQRPTMVGFISDQLPKWESMHFFVPFLHRETAVFTGAEQIGRQVGAAYFFGEMSRPRRGYYECTFRRMETPSTPVTDYDMTALFMQYLERMIRKAPQYWLWTHKRWKRTKEEWLERQRQVHGNA